MGAGTASSTRITGGDGETSIATTPFDCTMGGGAGVFASGTLVFLGAAAVAASGALGLGCCAELVEGAATDVVVRGVVGGTTRPEASIAAADALLKKL